MVPAPWIVLALVRVLLPPLISMTDVPPPPLVDIVSVPPPERILLAVKSMIALLAPAFMLMAPPLMI